MGIERSMLSDWLLARVSPADRKTAGLPPPISELAAKSVAKSYLKREKELQNQIVSWLRLRNVTVLWSRMDRRLTATIGWPDITFAVKGRAVALEAKLPGCEPTEDQRRVMAGLSSDGWAVKVVHSLDEARAVVESLL